MYDLKNAAGAVTTHASTLNTCVAQLQDARATKQHPVVVRQLAQRVLEAVEQIELTLGPIAAHTRRLLSET